MDEVARALYDLSREWNVRYISIAGLTDKLGRCPSENEVAAALAAHSWLSKSPTGGPFIVALDDEDIRCSA